jgi:prevent-host-death family protein
LERSGGKQLKKIAEFGLRIAPPFFWRGFLISKKINTKDFKMAIQVNIQEAKSNLSKLINQVIAGEEVIVAKSGKPVAKIVPIENPTQNRKPGSAKGKLTISDDFDAPLPDEILKGFYKTGRSPTYF